MEVDRDAVHSSPTSVSSIQRRRNLFFPPLPVVPDYIAQSTDSHDAPLSALSLPTGESQRAIMLNRNLQPARSGSLQNWVIPSTRLQHESQAQAPVVDVTADSPRNDVISVNDDSSDAAADDDDDDVIIDSDEETETVVERGENDEIEYVTDSDVADDTNSREAMIITGEEAAQADRPLSDQQAQDVEIGASVSRTEPRIEEAGHNIDTVNEQARRPSEVVERLYPDSSLVPTPSTGLSSSLTSNSSTSAQSHSASVPIQSTSVINQSETAPTLSTTVPTLSTSVSNSSAIVPVISAVAQLPTDSAESVSESSTGQTSHVTRVLERHNDSLSEFRSPKRKRIFSPEKKDTGGCQNPAKDDQEEEEGDSCPICFEAWTTSGSHRLCSLKCGHLFGQSCIEKWLKGQGGKCPHCNAKAKRQDIRVLFAKTIKALDTSERDRALKDLEKERELRRKVEMETAQLRLQYQMSIEDTNKLRLELETLKSQLRKSGQTPGGSVNTQVKNDASTSATQLSGQFVLEKTIKISEAGNCRVMAYSHSLATLVVSQPSSSQLFPGFGIKKISALDFKTSQYLTIHSKPIRDMAFHQTVEDGILLSCGLDKKVKMTSLISNTVIQAYDTPMPAWSCAWNQSDCNYFYAGLQNGLVLLFDVRNTGEPVQEFNKEGSRSPVASLVYVAGNQQADFRSSGLLIGQLDKVSFLEKTTQGERIHLLPLEGSLTSLHIDQQTRHMLASFRPTAKHPTIRHQLCDLTSTNISINPTVINHVCSCNVVHTFHGGRKQTVLSKTLILGHPGDQNRLLVCGGDESSNSVHIWDSGTGQLNQRLLADGMVVDLCKFNLNGHQYLAALTDRLCKVFKWR